MKGKRVEWSGILHRGEYAQHPNGSWYAMTPTGLLANLSKHDITIHDDGSITVDPSIMVERGLARQWHGYLERGVWREV